MTRPFFGEEIESILEGSYERLRGRVEKAISESAARLFGKDVSVTVEGTFNGYAVVVTAKPLSEGMWQNFKDNVSDTVDNAKKLATGFATGGMAGVGKAALDAKPVGSKIGPLTNPFGRSDGKTLGQTLGGDKEGDDSEPPMKPKMPKVPALPAESVEYNAWRVKYEIAENKEVMIVGCEPIMAAVFNEAQFAEQSARAFVEAFMRGTASRADLHFGHVVKHALEAAPPVEPTKLVESFETLVKSDRPWKKVYQEQRAAIQGAVRTDLPALEASRLQPKFRKLYDGTLIEGDLSGYQSLVTSDLTYLAERVAGLSNRVEAAREKLNGVVPALKKPSDPTLKGFEVFVEDLAADLRGIRNALTEGAKHTISLDGQAKLYDALVVELHQYDVAGLFVEAMTTRLSATAEEK